VIVTGFSPSECVVYFLSCGHFRVVPVPGFIVDKDKTKYDYRLLKYDAI
jgi:hypothetical protein